MAADDLRFQSIELSIHRITMAIESLSSTIMQQASYKEIPQFCTLRKAAELKGGKSYENLAKQKWFQPLCGGGWVRVGGVRCWTREAVVEWLDVTDSTLEAYAQKHGVDISKHFKNGRNI